MQPQAPVPPSVWLAAALLAGIALAPATLPAGPLCTAAPWLLVLLAICRRKRSPRVSAGLFLLAGMGLGLVRGAEDQHSAARRVGWLPEEGVAVELHLLGVVLGSAEPDAEGERLLRVLVHPELAIPAIEPLTVRLRVGPSTASAMARVDALASGDRVRIWARIRRPRSSGNPGERQASASLRAQGLDVVGSVKNAELIEFLAAGSPGVARGSDRVRGWARDRLDRSLGPDGPTRALFGAMLLGDRARLSADRQRMLRRAGLAHLVAISGLHVGLILWAVYAALGRVLRLRGWGRWSLSVSMLSGFACVVGGRASVWRAVLGAGAWLGGRCLGREGEAWKQLLLVAAVLAWFRPWSPLGPGFQLTFLAAAGILFLARPIREALPLPPAVGLGPAVGVAAYLATAPAVAWHFGWLAPVGLLTNLLALPVCAGVLVTGFAVLALGGLPGVGWVAVTGCEWASSAMWWIAERACSIDGGAIAVAPPEAPLLWLYYAVLAVAALGEAGPVLRRAQVALLGLALTWVHLGPPPARPLGRLEVRVIDVGQGLAVALRGPDGGVVLFDAGGSARGRFDPGERIVVPSLLRWSGKRIEMLVLSHGDVDHAGGAAAVLEGMEVGEIRLGPRSRQSPLLNRVREVARSRGVPTLLAERGHALRVAGIPIRILGPDRSWEGSSTNDGSVVILAGTAPNRVLLPGDLEVRGEAELLSSGESIRAEALIVAHHGSRSGSCTEFLDRARPEWAVVSAGFRNRFGHPHPEVQRRIAEAGARLLRTDLDGAVVVRASPAGWVVQGLRARAGQSPRETATGPE